MAACVLRANGERPSHAGPAPGLAAARRGGQRSPLLRSSGCFCGEGGWAGCRFPQQRGLARRLCEEAPAGKAAGKEGRSRLSRAFPPRGWWEPETPRGPRLRKAGESLGSSDPRGGLWAEQSHCSRAEKEGAATLGSGQGEEVSEGAPGRATLPLDGEEAIP